MTRFPVSFWFEAALAWTLYGIFRALPVDCASALGGRIGRFLGHVLPVTGRARRNLARVMPEMTPAERGRIVGAMWEHLGRVAGEFAHLGDFRIGSGERIEVEGLDRVRAFLNSGRSCLFVTAHIGNWELAALTGVQLGFKPLSVVYRAASNPLVDRIFADGRQAMGAGLIPKGSAGARQALQLLKKGGHLGMLVDQKMNDGISVPFFGIPAMTAPATAVFAFKFNCLVIPVRVIRLRGARFRVIFQEALPLDMVGDRPAATLDLMTRINRIYEGWIRDYPEQWLWLHNRWPAEP